MNNHSYTAFSIVLCPQDANERLRNENTELLSTIRMLEHVRNAVFCVNQLILMLDKN